MKPEGQGGKAKVTSGKGTHRNNTVYAVTRALKQMMIVIKIRNCTKMAVISPTSNRNAHIAAHKRPQRVDRTEGVWSWGITFS